MLCASRSDSALAFACSICAAFSGFSKATCTLSSFSLTLIANKGNASHLAALRASIVLQHIKRKPLLVPALDRQLLDPSIKAKSAK
jgi:hypothetical protein